jgi:hypothetical protein
MIMHFDFVGPLLYNKASCNDRAASNSGLKNRNHSEHL